MMNHFLYHQLFEDSTENNLIESSLCFEKLSHSPFLTHLYYIIVRAAANYFLEICLTVFKAAYQGFMAHSLTSFSLVIVCLPRF